MRDDLEMLYSRLSYIEQRKLLKLTYTILLNEERMNDLDLIKYIISDVRPLYLEGISFNFDKHKEILLINPNNLKYFAPNKEYPTKEQVEWVLNNMEEIFVTEYTLVVICKHYGILDLLAKKSYIKFVGKNYTLQNEISLIQNLHNYTKLSYRRRRFTSLSAKFYLNQDNNLQSEFIKLLSLHDFMVDDYIHTSMTDENVVLENVLTSRKRAKIYCSVSRFLFDYNNINLDYLFAPNVLMRLTEFMTEEEVIQESCYVNKMMFDEIRYLRKKSVN